MLDGIPSWNLRDCEWVQRKKTNPDPEIMGHARLVEQFASQFLTLHDYAVKMESNKSWLSDELQARIDTIVADFVGKYLKDKQHAVKVLGHSMVVSVIENADAGNHPEQWPSLVAKTLVYVRNSLKMPSDDFDKDFYSKLTASAAKGAKRVHGAAQVQDSISNASTAASASASSSSHHTTTSTAASQPTKKLRTFGAKKDT